MSGPTIGTKVVTDPITGKRKKVTPRKVYRTVADLLSAHPELRPHYDNRRAAALAPVFDQERVDAARRAWDNACWDANVRLAFRFVRGFGFPLEPHEDRGSC